MCKIFAKHDVLQRKPGMYIMKTQQRKNKLDQNIF